ncbi:unnamed protein product [Calypogeia fissa]
MGKIGLADLAYSIEQRKDNNHTEGGPMNNAQNSVLFVWRVEDKAYDARELGRSTGVQPTWRRFGWIGSRDYQDSTRRTGLGTANGGDPQRTRNVDMQSIVIGIGLERLAGLFGSGLVSIGRR